MTDINDQVVTAIQAYANTLPNPEFRLNLLAAAEHMAPELIKLLGLKQEWAVIETYRHPASEKPGDLMSETVEVIVNLGENPTYSFDELERLREIDDVAGDGRVRHYVGNRIVSDWAEHEILVLNADEQRQMDIDQAPVPG